MLPRLPLAYELRLIGNAMPKCDSKIAFPIFRRQNFKLRHYPLAACVAVTAERC